MTTSLVILAAEGGSDESLQLLPDTAELIWGIVGFALLFALLWRVAFPSLNQMLDQRQQAIQGRLTEAEEIRTEAEELRRQYQEQLRDARSRADEIVEEAKSDAERIREQKVSDAEQEAQSIRERAREDAEAERGRLVQQLRSQVAALSVDLAGRIVHAELDEQQHRSLVDDYIDRLSSMN
ncbi:MAG: F0F1 ATP synthase subunit B [Actinobacteria bacterium]|nr:F0F1 ATP synthase subunit B [Actinomycetota bacterium]